MLLCKNPKIMLHCKNAKINPNLKSKWAYVMTYDFAIKEYINEKSPKAEKPMKTGLTGYRYDR
jgi:hypothetical protein